MSFRVAVVCCFLCPFVFSSEDWRNYGKKFDAQQDLNAAFLMKFARCLICELKRDVPECNRLEEEELGGGFDTYGDDDEVTPTEILSGKIGRMTSYLIEVSKLVLPQYQSAIQTVINANTGEFEDACSRAIDEFSRGLVAD